MDDLDRFDVPPAPVHLSNSTDPFQPLEATAGNARLALRRISEHRRRFTTVVVLTRNPLMAAELGYIDLFLNLNSSQGGFLIEVSLAFWREEARAAYDPGAPGVQDRIEGIRRLRRAGVPVVLRIDPLFPRLPLAGKPGTGATYVDFGLCEPQTPDDVEQLVAFGREVGVRHVVYSPAKIVQPRMCPLSPTMMRMRSLYERVAAPERLMFRGGSWRLPPAAQSAVSGLLLDLCRSYGVPAKCCKQNLIETP